MKFTFWLAVLVLAFSVLWFVNYPGTTEEAYDEKEFRAVSSFMLYQRRETEVAYNYCKEHGYNADSLVTAFNQLYADKIARADKFVFSLNPMQRYAFRRELNRVFDQMRPQLEAQIEKAYDENKRAYALNNQDFTPQDFCRWLNENAASLLQRKTDLEVSAAKKVTLGYEI